MSYFKKHWPLLLVLLLIFVTIYPSIFLTLNKDVYTEIARVIDNFGKFSRNISFLNQPLSYYFTPYGTTFASDAVLYKLFEFNSMSYYILALIFKLMAVISIYYFVSKWTASRLTGFISSLFFGVSFPGIDNTIRVSLSFIYLAITLMFIFFDKWWNFHSNPTKKKAILSIIIFVLALLAYPVRMSGVLLMVFIGEIYWFFKYLKNKEKISLRSKHFIVLLIIFAILFFGTGTLSKTPEIQFKMISPKILIYSIFTGFPPVIMTFWLFVSNLIISPCSIPSVNNILLRPCMTAIDFLNPKLLQSLIYLLPFIGVIFLINSLFKKRFLIAFASLTVILFSTFVFNSKPYLVNWNPSWISFTQFGASIFLWAVLITAFFIWEKNRKLAEIGLLGILITVTNLIVPWMVSPQASMNDQSAFIFTHRYYTLPAVGMGLLFASLFAFLVNLVRTNLSKDLASLRQKFNLLILIKMSRIIVYSILPTIIVWIIFLNGAMTYNAFLNGSKAIDSRKTDIFWREIRPIFDNIKDGEPAKLIYVEHNGNLNEEYLTNLFPTRVAIYLGQIQKLPKVNFIFNKAELINIQNNQNFYAFRFDGKNIVDIKDEVIELLNK